MRELTTVEMNCVAGGGIEEIVVTARRDGGRSSFISSYRFFTSPSGGESGYGGDGVRDDQSSSQGNESENTNNESIPNYCDSGIVICMGDKDAINKALHYLLNSPTFKVAFEELKGLGVIISTENLENRNEFDYKNNTIHWSPLSGLDMEEGISSPATGLVHEITHALRFHEVGLKEFEKSLDLPTTVKLEPGVVTTTAGTSEEEARATKFEQKVQSELGEPVRDRYHDGDSVPVNSPLFYCHYEGVGKDDGEPLCSDL
ncbi:MAG: hypothetical protein ACR2PR_12175 [Pseudohongiellaceae bacterium]